MARSFDKFGRFPRGLVTDQVGVGGALLEANDVYYERPGEIRGRNGKSGSTTSLVGCTGLHYVPNINFQYPILASDGVGIYNYNRGPGGESGPLDASGTAGKVQQPGGSDRTFGGVHDGVLEAGNHGVEFGGELFALRAVITSANLPVRWAGSTEDSYTTGTVSGLSGAQTVTGSGTTWTSSMIGMYLHIDAATVEERGFRVVAVNSATELVVDRPFGATFAGDAYRLDPISWWSLAPGVLAYGKYSFTGASKHLVDTSSFSIANAWSCCAHQGRIFMAWVPPNGAKEWNDSRLVWTNLESESDGGQWGGAERIQANAYIDIDPGNGGPITGLASDGSSLYIFKQNAVYQLSGYVRSDGEPTGSTVRKIIGDDGLPDYVGLAPVNGAGGVLFTGWFGFYLIQDGQVRNLTEGRVSSLYRSMLTDNYAATAGILSSLSWTGKRAIMQGRNKRANAVADDEPNTLIWDSEHDVFLTQTTFICGRVRSESSWPLLYDLGIATSVEDTPGAAYDWGYDFMDPGPGSQRGYEGVSGSYVDVLPSITTHPMQLTGEMNARIRAVQILASFENTSSDPTLGVTLLMGEESRQDAVVVGDEIAAESGAEIPGTEEWVRLPVRAGTPPVAAARVRVAPSAATTRFRLYDIGLEFVESQRVR